jgi:hypothetical protein
MLQWEMNRDELFGVADGAVAALVAQASGSAHCPYQTSGALSISAYYLT